MSDENKPESNPNAELLARTEKLSQDNERLSKQLEQVLSTISQATQNRQIPVPDTDEDDLEVLAYKDPKKYAKKVQEEAEKRAEAIVNNRLNAQNQTSAVLAQLTADYPELSDANSDLTKKAIEYYNSMSNAEKASPSAYKIAVRDAAADVGLLPKSKRKNSGDDDFSFGGNSAGNRKEASKKGGELSQATIAFAEALGLDVNDKKTIERLKQRSERKDWGRYK